MKIIFTSGIRWDDLMNLITSLADRKGSAEVAVLVSPEPLWLEIYDTQTGLKVTGAEAIAQLVADRGQPTDLFEIKANP